MSRSYKKTPICKDKGTWGKRQANKKVRRFKDTIANGKAYKKVYCSWDICDWRWYETLPQALERVKEYSKWCRNFFSNPRFIHDYNEEREIKEWKKTYYWK